MIDKLVATSVMVAAPAAAAATTAASGDSQIAMLASVAVAMLSATFARAVSIFGPTSNKNKVWVYEIALIALCVLLSGSLAYDHGWTVGQAASYGGGIGFIGAGLKTIMEKVVKAFFASLVTSVAANDQDKAS